MKIAAPARRDSVDVPGEGGRSHQPGPTAATDETHEPGSNVVRTRFVSFAGCLTGDHMVTYHQNR